MTFYTKIFYPNNYSSLYRDNISENLTGIDIRIPCGGAKHVRSTWTQGS